MNALRGSTNYPTTLVKRHHVSKLAAYENGHYENMPMQYTEIFFSAVKIKNFIRKMLIFFLFLLKT